MVSTPSAICSLLFAAPEDGITGRGEGRALTSGQTIGVETTKLPKERTARSGEKRAGRMVLVLRRVERAAGAWSSWGYGMRWAQWCF